MSRLDPGIGALWLLIIILGLGTFGLRLSFIQLQDWIDGLPSLVEEALVFIPPAILAALIFPELFVLEASVIRTVINARAFAGALALLVAWRTGSMIATIGVGMGALWTIQFLIG